MLLLGPFMARGEIIKSIGTKHVLAKSPEAGLHLSDGYGGTKFSHRK